MECKDYVNPALAITFKERINVLIINFSDFTVGEYYSDTEAKEAILEAYANDVFVDSIQDEDENIYSLLWSVEIQKESIGLSE